VKGKCQKKGRDCAGTVAEVRGAKGRVTLGCSLPRAIQTDRKPRDRDNLGDPPVHASPRTDGRLWGRRWEGSRADVRANCTSALDHHFRPWFCHKNK
jgi:hypothetical protein